MKATDKVLNWDVMQEVLHYSLVSLTRDDRSSYDQWEAERNTALKKILEEYSRRVIQLAMLNAGGRPKIGFPGWKAYICNCAQEVAIKNGLRTVRREFTVRIYGEFPHITANRSAAEPLKKIAATAATAAFMVVHGLSPDLLLMSRGEVLAAVRTAA